MLYKIVIWILGCTAADGLEVCPTGDFTELPTRYTALKQCENSKEMRAWVSIDKDTHRAACIPADMIIDGAIINEAE